MSVTITGTKTVIKTRSKRERRVNGDPSPQTLQTLLRAISTATLTIQITYPHWNSCSSLTTNVFNFLQNNEIGRVIRLTKITGSRYALDSERGVGVYETRPTTAGCGRHLSDECGIRTMKEKTKMHLLSLIHIWLLLIARNRVEISILIFFL